MKDSFLQLVADDLLATFGNDLRRVCLVFPGQRARLFLNPLLVKGSGAVWAPRYTDMSQLFQSLSPYSLIDPIEAVCLLHGVYASHVADAESLDEFFSWGRVLLADFDDIDKHLVDARQLFANITALRQMDTVDFLTAEQMDALQHFFANFSAERHTELKERFLRLWEKMLDIYTDWHDLMRSRKTLTEGAMFRDVIENNRVSMLLEEPDTVYAFAGFNVLDNVEEKLMISLQRAGHARFYWDYDVSYVNDMQAEAGEFMRRNLVLFPSVLPAGCFDNMSGRKDITFVATGGENVQARYVKKWTERLSNPTSTANAVVLCNEGLLNAVLHSMPDAAHKGPKVANITMGFPARQTPACSYLQALMSLQTDGWDAGRNRFSSHHKRLVTTHPLFCGNPFEHEEGASWLLSYLQRQIAGIKADDALTRETVFRLYTMLSRLRSMTDEGTLNVTVPTLARILTQALAAINVPFHGEPVIGMQIMGMLETRCLDFENVLLLSVGEGYMPQNPHASSFIPYHLRRPFGLTTIEHKVAVQAYYFYRLLQRAGTVTCVYNTAATDGVKNEMSRFLRQLLAEGRFSIKTLSLAPDLRLQRTAIRPVAEKTAEVMAALCENVRSVTPTTLNTYLECPLRFYMHKVAGIKEPDTPDVDVVDNAKFGTIFHNSAKEVYEQIGHKHILASDLERFVGAEGKETPQSRDLLMSIVARRFDEDYFSLLPDTDGRYTGQMLIQRDVIADYLRRLLLHDYRLAPFDILKLEEWCTVPLTISGGRTINAGGQIDRLDMVDMDGVPTIRVVDYKSGRFDAAKLHVQDMDSLFEHGGYAFQTFVYSLAVCGAMENGTLADAADAVHGMKRLPVVPALFYIQQSANECYNPVLTYGEGKDAKPIADFHDLADDMRRHLVGTLEEIFNPSVPFTAAPIGSDACKYCPFTNMCGR